MDWIINSSQLSTNGTVLIGLAFFLLLVTMRLLSTQRETTCELEHNKGKILVVLVHGLTGQKKFESAISLARDSIPGSDLLKFNYNSGILSNKNPYAIANVIEREIHAAHLKHNYSEIVLIGYSVGGMLLRKAIVWSNGLEEDRHQYGPCGERDWIQRTTRFVSLATVNRGWSIKPRPDRMKRLTYILIWIIERLARLSQSGQLALALQRGAPFVADARVQWIALCRGEQSVRAKVPQTIHLLGDKDDLVSKEDSMDIGAAKNTIFVTLQETGHREIGWTLDGGTTKADQDRRHKVQLAIQGKLNQLEPDKAEDNQIENRSVERIVYVMHGIRDYGEWTDKLRLIIETKARTKGANGASIAVVNHKYGHFPILPFLLYWDRQKNVRQFMDEYTENRARFPLAKKFDYVGHSNGTYILASALEHYKTLKVERVYFAGSVVPKHYPWRVLADCGRVTHVSNIYAARDWVVALGPRFFEQIAEWLGKRPVRGLLDIGSGGYRGFESASDPEGRIENIKFSGGHSSGVDANDENKMNAIARYIVFDDKKGLTNFPVSKDGGKLEKCLNHASNLSWILWLVFAFGLIGLGLLVFKQNIWAGWTFILFLILLLNSC